MNLLVFKTELLDALQKCTPNLNELGALESDLINYGENA